MVVTAFLALFLGLTCSQIFVDDSSSCTNTSECGTDESPFQTIQEALDAVTNNQGSIILKAGTYRGEGNTNLTVSNTFSQLYGEGSDVTIIDCENKGYLPGFGLSSGTFTIQGISVRNCKAVNRSINYNGVIYHGIWGGALWIQSAYTVIKDILIEANSAEENGGGLAIFSDAVEISDSVIRNNKAKNGGGIFITKAYIKLTNVTIEENEVTGYGGGMYGINGGTVELLGTSTVEDNTADDNGDQVACVNGTNFVIKSDDSEIGDGVYCDDCLVGKDGEDYCDSNNKGEMVYSLGIGCFVGLLLVFV